MTLVLLVVWSKGACGDENEGARDRLAADDADSPATARCATADDLLKEHPDLAP